jgi:hypothetical protein
MKINYFDLGLYKGTEMGWMIEKIFPKLGIENYSAYGFEACGKYSKGVSRHYDSNDKVKIEHLAISSEEKTIRLYRAKNAVGHSIYSTKRNVNQKNFEEVRGMRFSEWAKQNDINFKSCFNIMKINIEGAEWPLFQDLVSTNIIKDIDIFCGAGHDVKKVGELEEIVDDYYKLLEDHDVHFYRFTEYKAALNDDLAKIIRKKYMENT